MDSIGFGRPKADFLAPKNGLLANLVQKVGLWTTESQNGDHFLSIAIPKIGGLHLFRVNIALRGALDKLKKFLF